MKKMKCLTLIVVAVMLLGVSCAHDLPEPEYYKVTFFAQNGGWIKGKEQQTVLEGNSTEQVIAVPFEGYVFTGWAGSLERTPERVIKNVKESRTYVACFEKKQLDIQYLATENGSIGGETTQKVVYGENAQTVTAIPKEGYMFSGWSDNITTAKRQDTQVKESICVTANFERLKKEFTFDYNYATENCEKKDILLTYGELQDVKFPVPVREHFTFNGWYLGNAPVSDSAGNPVIGNEIFYNNRTRYLCKVDSQRNVYL